MPPESQIDETGGSFSRNVARTGSCVVEGFTALTA
jgi:hypothetical protein